MWPMASCPRTLEDSVVKDVEELGEVSVTELMSHYTRDLSCLLLSFSFKSRLLDIKDLNKHLLPNLLPKMFTLWHKLCLCPSVIPAVPGSGTCRRP